jgi:hypothetical protein
VSKPKTAFFGEQYRTGPGVYSRRRGLPEQSNETLHASLTAKTSFACFPCTQPAFTLPVDEHLQPEKALDRACRKFRKRAWRKDGNGKTAFVALFAVRCSEEG